MSPRAAGKPEIEAGALVSKVHAGARANKGYVNMKTFLKTFLKDESGASAAEYALIIAVVGVGIIVAAIALGSAVGNSMNCAATTIEEQNIGSLCNS